MNPAEPPHWLASPEATHDDVQILLDRRGHIVRLNEEAQMLSGQSESESRDRPFEEVFPLRDEFSGAPPTPYTRAVVLPVRGGDLRAFDLIVVPIPSDLGWSVVLRPIIASGDVEHEAWANLAGKSKEGTGLGDPVTNTIGLVSYTFARIYGYTPEEMLGMPLARLFLHDGQELKQFGERIRQGRVSWESQQLRKDGTVFPALLSVTTIRDPLGQERFQAMRVEDISERKAAERREREQRNLVDRVIALVPSVVYLINATEGHMRFLSLGVAAALGYDAAQGPEPGVETTDARFTSEALHPEDRPRMVAHRERLPSLRDGEVATFEYRVRDASGSYRWFLSRDTVFERDERGRVGMILGAATDVTELKTLSEELRETEALRDVAASAAVMASWWWNLETGWARVWNDEGRIYGFPSSTAPGEEFRTSIEDLLSRIDPRDRDRMEAAVRLTMTEGTDFEEEVRAMGTGEPRWLLAKGRRKPNAEGRPSILAGVSIDIHARKQTEAALRERELEMRRLVESATEYAIFTIDLERRVTSWNSGAAKIFGYSEGEILGQSSDVLFTSEDRASGEPDKECAEALAVGRASDDRWHLRNDGSRFFASGASTPMTDDDGKPYGFVKIARDLTEGRLATRELEKSEARYRTLFESIDEGYALVELLRDEKGVGYDYRYVEINPIAERQSGVTGMVGRTARELFPGLDDEWVRIYSRVADTGEPLRFEKDFGDRSYTIFISRVGGEGSPLLATISDDVTDRKRREQELRESEAMLRVGLGASGGAVAFCDLTNGEIRFGGDVMSVYGLPLGTGTVSWSEMEARVPPDEMIRFAEVIAEADRTGGTFTFEHGYRRFDGRLGRIRATGKVLALDPARPEAKTLIGVNFPVEPLPN